MRQQVPGWKEVSKEVQSILSSPVLLVLICRWRVALRFADHETKRNGGSGDEDEYKADNNI